MQFNVFLTPLQTNQHTSLPMVDQPSLQAASLDGKITVACVFERLPVVMPAFPSWEIEHEEWRANLVAKYSKKLPKEFTDPKKAEQQAGEQGGNQWQPAPLETAADKSGDKKSLRRRLDQRIFFLVKPKSGAAASEWTMPAVEVQEGETTRQAAERALAETVTLDTVQPYFVGNAPAGHVENSAGDKLFFHRCQLIQGKPALQAGGRYSDGVWVTKDEFKEYIKDQHLGELLEKML